MLTLGEIKGVGAATLKKLEELGIKSVFELLSFFPSRYINLSDPISISDASVGQLSLFEGTVTRVSAPSKRGKRGFYVTFSDDINKKFRFRATFYNMPFLHGVFEEGKSYRLLGKLADDPDMFNIVNPQCEKTERASKLNKGVYVQYPLKGIIGLNTFKNIMYAALDDLKTRKYDGATGRVNLDMSRCFEAVHRPRDISDAERGLKCLASIDMAIVLLIFKKLSDSTQKIRKVFYKTANIRTLDYINSLPFTLTESQLAAIEEISASLKSDENMSRIISGDVGSGKTAVAFFAAYFAAAGGRQAAIMAPTEILATQHAKSFKPIADKLGINFALLTASTPPKEREFILDGLASGEISCVIGTQALISDAVIYKDLALAVIDEQHKFGVRERKSLENKGAKDILSMTATPIPRSMALTFYDDIAISYIKRRKEATSNIVTRIVEDANIAIDEVVARCKGGGQAFIVCPAIVDSEGYDIFSVEKFMSEYKQKFEGISVCALHGKMSNEQKNAAMSAFAEGKISLLVATNIVEVGVDTRASDMIILDADRFGLASLHQLRGRVGRDGRDARCYLVSKSASERLKALEASNDGQFLAEVDFETRGAGDFVGTRQSGASLTPIFSLKMNAQILSNAKSYCEDALKDIPVGELISLTRRSEGRVRAFIEELNKVTLNS